MLRALQCAHFSVHGSQDSDVHPRYFYALCIKQHRTLLSFRGPRHSLLLAPIFLSSPFSISPSLSLCVCDSSHVRVRLAEALAAVCLFDVEPCWIRPSPSGALLLACLPAHTPVTHTHYACKHTHTNKNKCLPAGKHPQHTWRSHTHTHLKYYTFPILTHIVSISHTHTHCELQSYTLSPHFFLRFSLINITLNSYECFSSEAAIL